jgi:hypothetical protein
MFPTIKSLTLLTKTQAQGAQEFASLGVFDSARLHQLAVFTSATPAAGVLQVAIKPVDSSSYITLSDTIPLTAAPVIYQWYGFAAQLQVTPIGFDADKTYSVYLTIGDI